MRDNADARADHAIAALAPEPEKFHALREISFAVHHGESVAIIGHNGAGKSTLLNLTTRLCQPDRGGWRYTAGSPRCSIWARDFIRT